MGGENKMEQVKIGKFIASKRKEQGLTQLQLAEKLGITDRAVSKWETGKSLPDASLMPELCKLLKITINDLLCGEVVSVENYNEKAEKALLEMVKKEEMQNKKLMMYENVIGFSSTLSFLIQVLVAVFFVKNTTAQILLLILAFAFLIVGVSFALKIEA